MTLRNDKASKVPGAINHILHEPPKKVDYWFTLVCAVSYVDTMWNQTRKYERGKLSAWLLAASKTEMQYLSTESSHEKKKEEQHLILATAHDEITRYCQNMSIGSAVRNELTSVYQEPLKTPEGTYKNN